MGPVIKHCSVHIHYLQKDVTQEFLDSWLPVHCIKSEYQKVNM